VDARRRVAGPQLGEHRDGVDHVPHRRRLDEEDPLEVLAAERGSVHGISPAAAQAPARTPWRGCVCRATAGMGILLAYATFSRAGRTRVMNFFIHADMRWRISSRCLTNWLVTQLSWITRRGPMNGLWPCHELSLRRKASRVPSTGGTSRMASSRSAPE